MSNREMNAFLKVGLPVGVRLSGTESCLHLIICHRYDTRADKRSAYPGMVELQRVTGLSRSTIENALRGLREKGIVTQVQKGYVGKRAEYVPTYALSLLVDGESVAYANTYETKVLPIQAESVINTGRECRGSRDKVSRPPVTISTLSTVNTRKYNVLRFDLIQKALPERLRTISSGSNLETLLDESDDLEISDDILRLLAENRWDNVSVNAGGIVCKIIKDAIDRKNSGQLVIAPLERTYQPPQFDPVLDDPGYGREVTTTPTTPPEETKEAEQVLSREETQRLLREFRTGYTLPE